MRELGPFQRELSDLRRTTGWGKVECFLSPHTLLDDAPPAELLIAAPLRVLHTAHLELQEYQGKRQLSGSQRGRRPKRKPLQPCSSRFLFS